MAELSTAKFNPESHLLLDQPLLRLTYELSRNNFRTAHRQIEQSQTKVLEAIQTAAKSSGDSAQSATASIDQAIQRLQTLKRKLSTLSASQETLSKQSEARIQHLDELHHFQSLTDVKYEEWSRVRLDRLLVDYLLRQGYTKSARDLSTEKKIEALVDLDEFEAVGRIEKSLRIDNKVDHALAWCGENKANLKKMNSNLEYELRLQQYVELARTGEPEKLLEAAMHARKYLASNPDSSLGIRSAGLLAFEADTQAEPFLTLYSLDRWSHLADMFRETHHTLFSLPQQPLLHIALSAGLSALKTPACHSKFISPTSGLNSSTSPPHNLESNGSQDHDSADGSPFLSTSLANSVCPICSTELNKLAKNVPYAHHSKSHVESDPVVLPNGRIYGRERLLKLNEKLGTPAGWVKDPVEVERVFEWNQVRKVFIS